MVTLALLVTGCGSGSDPGGTRVTFDTEDGVRLSGRLFGSGDVAVVLSHMRTADQESWWPFARVLADRGYQALAFDFRGYGDSGGELQIDHLDMDVQAALNFLQGRGVSRVFLIGASMGGTASLKVASRQEVAGVITLSAPPAIEGLDAREDVKQVNAPKLFIAAREDTQGFYMRSVDLFNQTAPEPRERQIVEGNAHGTDLLSGEPGPRVQGLMVDFLDRYR
ncbi:MAG: alpha/beta hydrolase [Dehalococcoidia bacterium]|nr:alpha/beta hydrolase [Dehalococcoidia bacterium]